VSCRRSAAHFPKLLDGFQNLRIVGLPFLVNFLNLRGEFF
jgi:hypothetical protein